MAIAPQLLLTNTTANKDNFLLAWDEKTLPFGEFMKSVIR